MSLANVKIEEEQSAKESKIKLNRLNEDSKSTIFNLLKLPDLDKKGIKDK